MPVKRHRYFFLLNATPPRKTSNMTQSTTPRYQSTNKAKFLGVTFDSSLSFTTHIKLIAMKAKHRIMHLHHLQPVIRSISSHHDSPIQNIRMPTFRIRSHCHQCIIQKHKHLGRHPIHTKTSWTFPHIQSKCRQIWEPTIQTSPPTPF